MSTLQSAVEDELGHELKAAAAEVACVVAEQRVLLTRMEANARAHLESTEAAMHANLTALLHRLHGTLLASQGAHGPRGDQSLLGLAGGRCAQCRCGDCPFHLHPWSRSWHGIPENRPGEAGSCVKRLRRLVATGRQRVHSGADSAQGDGRPSANVREPSRAVSAAEPSGSSARSARGYTDPGRYTAWRIPAAARLRPLHAGQAVAAYDGVTGKIGQRVGPRVHVASGRTTTGGLVPGGVSLRAFVKPGVRPAPAAPTA